MPAYNITNLVQGATWSLAFRLNTADDFGNLVPVPLAGYFGSMQIRDKIGGTVLLQFDSAMIGGMVINDVTNVITVTATPEQTASLTVTTGVYDLFLVSQDGLTTRQLYGNVYISLRVTQ